MGLSRDKQTLHSDFVQDLIVETPAHDGCSYTKNLMPNARRVVFRPVRDKTWLLCWSVEQLGSSLSYESKAFIAHHWSTMFRVANEGHAAQLCGAH